MTTPGRSWLITTVANGKYLTYDLFTRSDFEVDECHYTSDAAVVYTYIHLKRCVHLTTIKFFLERLEVEMGIVLFEIFGYDSVTKTGTSMNDITDHVGFKVLLAHYQTQNPAFTSCTDGNSGILRGLFWKCDAIPRIKGVLMKRSRMLATFFDEMEKELEMYKEKAAMVDMLQEQLLNAESEAESFGHFKFVYHVLEYRISQLDKASQKKLLEPDHLGRQIFPDSVFFRRLYQDES